MLMRRILDPTQGPGLGVRRTNAVVRGRELSAISPRHPYLLRLPGGEWGERLGVELADGKDLVYHD